MSEQEVYQRLINWMKNTWWGMPEGEELMPLMKATFTPEDAQFLIGMPLSAKRLAEVAEIKQMEPDELKPKLDALSKKGIIFYVGEGETARYRLNDSLFIFLRSSFWAGGTDERTKAMAPLVNQYYYHGFFDKFNLTHHKGLRALPVDGTIEDTREILPYEEVAKVLDSFDYYAVSTCACKHRKNVDPDSPDCPYPAEVCLHFDRLGRYTVENGLGREITRQEAEEILRKSAEAGLVHGVDNWQEGITTICNCDPCCCIFFEAYHKLKHSTSLSSSNYRVRTNPETCIGCGLCVKRCHMEALHLEDYPGAKDRITKLASGKEIKNKTGQVSVLNPDLCIGCGVCAYKCPTHSLVLERREVIEHPPQDMRECNRLILTDFAAHGIQIPEGMV